MNENEKKDGRYRTNIDKKKKSELFNFPIKKKHFPHVLKKIEVYDKKSKRYEELI